MYENTEELYIKALNRFGSSTQEIMLMEEAAEVIQAMSHFRRGRCGYTKLVGELCDLQIMIEQMRILYGIQVFDEMMETKIESLDNKLVIWENGGIK